MIAKAHEVSAQLRSPVHFMPHVAPFFRGLQVTVIFDSLYSPVE